MARNPKQTMEDLLDEIENYLEDNSDFDFNGNNYVGNRAASLHAQLVEARRALADYSEVEVTNV